MREFTVKGVEEYLDRASEDEAGVLRLLNTLMYYDSPCGSKAGAGWCIEEGLVEEDLVEDLERLTVSGSGDKGEDDDTTWKEDSNDDGAEYFTLLMRAVIDANDYAHGQDEDQDQSHSRDEVVALELVHYILVRGADPNVSTLLGTTALMLACEVLLAHRPSLLLPLCH